MTFHKHLTLRFNEDVRFDHRNELILQYTVYKSPRDYPGKFVIRQFYVDASGARPCVGYVCDTLDEARSLVEPFGLICMPRFPNDEPQIVEVWI